MCLDRSSRLQFLYRVRANMLRHAGELEAEPNAFALDFFQYRPEDLSAYRAQGIALASKLRATYTENWVNQQLVHWYAQEFAGERIAA